MNDALATLQLNVAAVLPEIVLVVATLILMMMDAFGGDGDEAGSKRALPWVAMAGVLAAGASVFWLWSQEPISFQGHAISDHFANSVRLIVLAAAALGILFSHTYIVKINRQTGEYYALLLLCTAGMGLMGAATDLIVL
ncbi:MAG: hypothetical protein ACRC1H_06500, partial [Caldilineaceae bacterium]